LTVGASAANFSPAGAATTASEPESNEKKPQEASLFIPSHLQQEILEVLHERVFKLDSLAQNLKKDRSSLHRHGLKELLERGLVKNNRRVGGYYRPDAPPSSYAAVLSGCDNRN
jgi:hypothetical protein